MDARTLPPHRRLFLTATAGSFCAALLTDLGRAGDAAIGRSAITLQAKQQPLVRVRMEMDVKGNVKVSKNPLASRQVSQTFPIESNAVLDYEERPLMPPGADRASEIVAAERYYHQASSSSVLNKSDSRRELRPEMRQVVVRRERLPESIYSLDNYFTHDELSLLKCPVSSLSVDRLLPAKAVLQGDRYEIPSDTLCSVLNLSSVDRGQVECRVTEVGDDAVRFQLEGDVEASVDGVDTRLRLLGKMTFDRDEGICTWLALAVHETRAISRAEPGFDISATIKMVRRPMRTPVALPPQPAPVDLMAEIPRDRMYVELQSRNVKIGSMMDRRWRMIEDRPGAAVMRMIEHDLSIAQCNVRPLVRLPEEKTLTLAAFESDVRATLGEKLRQLIEGDERTSAQGLSVLRVVADGETQGVPIRWIMMHFSDADGRRIQATFTMSVDQIESFAGSDAQFADSLRFLELPSVDQTPANEDAITQQTGGESSKSEPRIADRTAAATDTPAPERSKSDATAGASKLPASASDLR